MNWSQVEGQWKQVKGQVKSRWAKLTDDDLKTLGAKKDMLVGKIQERYGVLKDEAETQVDEWIDKLSAHADDGSTKESQQRTTEQDMAATQPGRPPSPHKHA
jgi:uncharacterized protein YjbJ (UPF0337 family)